MEREDLIKKWLNDKLTPAEKQMFERGEDFALHHAIVDNAKHFKASNFSKPESFQDLQSTYQSQKSNKKQLNWLRPLLRIASVLVIILGIYFTFFNTNLTVVEALVNQQVDFELPDHSQLTLNAGSKIEFNKTEWKDNRHLNLEGEAYFKVAKGETFDVVTSQGVVSVVGTKFNVKQRDTYFEVQCFEGIVKVTTKNSSKTLLAGDMYRLLNNQSSLDKTAILSPEWMHNKSTFKAIPFKEVIAELERQYDIKIKLSNVNSERLFTGGFIHDNIETALFSITQPMSLSYKTNTSNEVIIYGNKK